MTRCRYRRLPAAHGTLHVAEGLVGERLVSQIGRIILDLGHIQNERLARFGG